MNYIEKVRKNNLLVKKYYEQVLDRISNPRKGKVRKEIREKIFDLEDAIADNNKLIMLAMTILLKFYFASFDKNDLSKEDVEIIETWAKTMAKRETRFNEQFQEEGEKLINKLFNRQEEIAEIIKKIYSGEV